MRSRVCTSSTSERWDVVKLFIPADSCCEMMFQNGVINFIEDPAFCCAISALIFEMFPKSLVTILWKPCSHFFLIYLIFDNEQYEFLGPLKYMKKLQLIYCMKAWLLEWLILSVYICARQISADIFLTTEKLRAIICL